MHNPTNDNVLVHFLSFQKGEEKGFAYFFHIQYEPLCYFAFNILHHKEAAEDVVEESFIKLWQNRARIRHSSVIKSYLYTSVKNACIDLIRRKKTFSGFAETTKFISEKHETSVLNKIISAEVINEIHQAMNTLPPKMAKVFRMLYVEGKGYQEVADELKVSIHTIRHQKARAIILLKQKLPQHLFLFFFAAILLK